MAYTKTNPDDVALLLIDHQDGTMSWMKSIEVETVKKNTVLLAKTAKILGIPVVLTTSMEDQVQGPIFKELAAAVPDEFQARVKRHGAVNAMDDANFAAAVKATGRSQFIIAGVTNDVCAVFPTLTLRGAGHEVTVVADAGGSPSKVGDDLALQRMASAGAVVVGTNQAVAELAQDWSKETSNRIMSAVKDAM